MTIEKPRIGISSCLLGQRVRYNGEHTRDIYLTETLGRYVEWIPVCPELEVGMGVPREPVRLVGAIEDPSLVGERSGRDWTAQMRKYSHERVRQMRSLDLAGYIFKKNSPSCGMERVRVYTGKGAPARQGQGIFASILMKEWPLLPVEEEGRLNNPRLRENFIERVFAFARWKEVERSHKSRGSLVEFHSRNKFLILTHSEQHLKRLGRLVAESKKHPLGAVFEKYGCLFMQALEVPATVRKHTNTLHHMMGYFSDQLVPSEGSELLEVIRDYHRGLTPLIVPITLMRHYVRKYNISYLADQVYLQPHPKELMLRNHV